MPPLHHPPMPAGAPSSPGFWAEASPPRSRRSSILSRASSNPPKVAEVSVNEVAAGKVQDLKPNSGKIVKFGNKPALLVRINDTEWKAFSAVCTHLNCTVQYQDARREIWCACHNGTYDLERPGGLRTAAQAAGRAGREGPRRRSRHFAPARVTGRRLPLVSRGNESQNLRLVRRTTRPGAWRAICSAHKVVPLHSGTTWYYFGGITLFLFASRCSPGSCCCSTTGPQSPKPSKRAVHHDPRAVRLADPLHPQLVRQPDDLCRPSFTCSAWFSCAPTGARAS